MIVAWIWAFICSEGMNPTFTLHGSNSIGNQYICTDRVRG